MRLSQCTGSGIGEWVSLPGGFGLKLGRFFQRFGTLNRWHIHALPFESRSLPHIAFFGHEPLGQTGASVSWLAPFALAGGTFEGTVEVTRGENEALFGEPGRLTLLTHLNAFWALSRSTDLDVGLSWIGGDFENEVEAGEARVKRSEAYHERIARAAATNAVSQQELTDAIAQLEMSQAQLKIREKALSDSRIVAPFAGTVAVTYVENFWNVRAKQAVIRLLDTSKIKVDLNLPEDYISLIAYVKTTHCKFHAFPDHVVRVLQESRRCSRYQWGPVPRRVEIRFTAGGESFLPAALVKAVRMAGSVRSMVMPRSADM